MFAIVVQTLLPFVLAGAIVGTADATPICHAGSGDDHNKSGQSNPANTCPICTALAASAAITTAPPPTIPLPLASVRPVEPNISQVSAEASLPASYHSRAPPLA